MISKADEVKKRLVKVNQEVEAAKIQRKQLIKQQSERKTLAEQLKFRKSRYLL